MTHILRKPNDICCLIFVVNTHFKEIYTLNSGRQVKGTICCWCTFFLNYGALCLAQNLQAYLIINIHAAQRFIQRFGCWNQVLSSYRSEPQQQFTVKRSMSLMNELTHMALQVRSIWEQKSHHLTLAI